MAANRNSNAYLNKIAEPLRALEIMANTKTPAAVHASGAVLFTGVEIPDAVMAPGDETKIVSAYMLCADANKVAIDLWITQYPTLFGALGAAPSITTVDLFNAKPQGGPIVIGSTFASLAGVAVADLDMNSRIVKAAPKSTSLYLHGLAKASVTPTGFWVVLGVQDSG